MKYTLLPLLIFLSLLACTESKQVAEQPQASPIDHVDPFIGTAAHGHTYPGATVPFGMVQLSPNNGTPGWDWCSGYNYVDSIIVGFAHTHLSGTGIGDLYDVLVMPTTATVDFHKPIKGRDDYDYHSAFSHDEESASPGYYAVHLTDSDIEVKLTATNRVGFHHYTFPKSENASVVIDLGYKQNWDMPTDSYLEVVNDSLVTGYRFSTGWAKDQRVYFAAMFSQPFERTTLAEDTIMDGDVREIKAHGQFHFETEDQEVIMLKVGLSSASTEAALAAISEEIPHWDFEATHESAQAAWTTALNKIQVKSANAELKKIFYTALYHTQLAPVTFEDALGQYKGVDGKVQTSEGYTRYDILSLWDTFRAQNPLLTIVQPDRVNDLIQTMLAHYREYGLLPVWSLLGNETNTMTGYHAIPVIVDAYLKGFRDYDVEEAFAAMKKSAMQDIRGTDFLREYNYIPYDKAGQSVTRTLEYCYDDWCIAQMAKALGKTDDYEYFMKRAHNYENLFDASTGFMRAKLADGTWKSPFDPQYSSHDFSKAEYTEGNAWQHSWFVPHDIGGLIQLHGGNEPFITKLDSLFTISSEIRGENASADISGLIGQYAHGNEPSHHIAYMYAYAGAPWKTQERVRMIMESQYTTQPDGLCGNEDCGQMSAWYVMSAMGLYPVNPAEGIYVLGSPIFEEVAIDMGQGKKFEVIAKNNSKENIYVQSATLNDQPLTRLYLTHEELRVGGKLVLEMGPTPNKEWAVTAPPSM